MSFLFEFLFTFVAATFLLLLITIYSYFKYTFSYWSRKGVLQDPPIIPFGNAKDSILQRKHFGENVHDLYRKYKKTGRKYIGFYVFTKPHLLILDPELVKTILTKDFAYFSNRLHRQAKNDIITRNILFLSGQKWKNLRQKLTPVFTSGKVKAMFQIITNSSIELEKKFQELSSTNEAIDAKDIFDRFAIDNIASCAFGLECNSIQNPDSDIRTYGKIHTSPNPSKTFKIIIRNMFPRLYNYLGLKSFNPKVMDFFQNLVKQTVEYREKNNVTRNDFMQLMINIKNTGDVDGDKIVTEPGKTLTLDEIASQCFLFFSAGFETSSAAMAFFLYEMAMNQDIQERVRQEIQDMLERYDGKLTYEGVMELQYLDWAINESMRLHPSIQNIQRRCSNIYRMPDSDLVIEKGTNIVISAVGMQSDPEYFPEPERFDPERFSPEQRNQRHPSTFLPFGEGPRQCIGIRFGLLQSKVGIIVALKNHRFTISSKTRIPLKSEPDTLLLSAAGGIWLHAERI